MNRSAPLALLAALTSAAAADVVTHRIDFFPDEAGQYTLQLRFFGPTQGRIIQTRVYLDFTTQHGFDAATLSFLLHAPVSNSPGQSFYTVTGGELGWEGEGQFSRATVTTDALNGELFDGLWVFDLGSTNEPASFSGVFTPESRVEVDIEVPDAPPCPADFNQDGGVDGADVEAFFLAWQDADPSADVNQDGGVDGSDVETFFVAWEAGGC